VTGSPEPSPRPARSRLLRRALLAAAVLLALLVLWQAITWPRPCRLATKDPQTTAFIERFGARERSAGREPRVRWTPVPLERMAPSLPLAVLVAEDDRFFSHRGFATEEIRKALRKAVDEREAPRGASTITQQLAKNLWLSPSRNPLRKAKETLLTMQLERCLTKQRILELYLNVCELGPGIYGAEAASQAWFGKPASALTSDESAQLAATLSRPSKWHPGVATRGYAARVALIRDRMRRWPWVYPPRG
jgi:monofunctional glycosyltransferase